MTKKTITLGQITVALDDWEVQVGRYVCVYLVNKALKNDQEAKELLNAIGVTLYDNDNVQVWPALPPNPPVEGQGH